MFEIIWYCTRLLETHSCVYGEWMGREGHMKLQEVHHYSCVIDLLASIQVIKVLDILSDYVCSEYIFH